MFASLIILTIVCIRLFFYQSLSLYLAQGGKAGQNDGPIKRLD